MKGSQGPLEEKQAHRIIDPPPYLTSGHKMLLFLIQLDCLIFVIVGQKKITPVIPYSWHIDSISWLIWWYNETINVIPCCSSHTVQCAIFLFFYLIILTMCHDYLLLWLETGVKWRLLFSFSHFLLLEDQLTSVTWIACSVVFPIWERDSFL